MKRTGGCDGVGRKLQTSSSTPLQSFRTSIAVDTHIWIGRLRFFAAEPIAWKSGCTLVGSRQSPLQQWWRHTHTHTHRGIKHYSHGCYTTALVVFISRTHRHIDLILCWIERNMWLETLYVAQPSVK